jgi:hypothetical protein
LPPGKEERKSYHAEKAQIQITIIKTSCRILRSLPEAVTVKFQAAKKRGGFRFLILYLWVVAFPAPLLVAPTTLQFAFLLLPVSVPISLSLSLSLSLLPMPMRERRFLERASDEVR